MTKGESLILLEKIKDECDRHEFFCTKCPFYIPKGNICVFAYADGGDGFYEYLKEELQNESNK